MKKRVHDFCNRAVTTVDGGQTLREAALVMKAKRIGSVLIVSDGAPVGILTERDFQDKVVAGGLDVDRTTVGDVMTTSLIHVAPQDSIDDVILAMKSNRIRHVPVVEHGRLIGLLSLRDVILTRDAMLEQAIREKTRSLQQALARKRDLVRFNKKINGTLELERLLDIIDADARDLLGVERYSLFEYDKARHDLSLLRAGHLPATPPVVIAPAAYVNTLIDDALHDRKIKEIEDFHEYQYIPGAEDRSDYDPDWCLCAPLIHGGEILGILNVSDKLGEMKNFTAAEMEYLGVVADNIAAALANCLAHRELRATEERLAQQSKLASIGQLAAGVAHELNNPLEAISRYCQVMLADCAEGTQERTGLDRILRETRRASSIVRNLLSFSRKGELQCVPVDVHRVLADSIELCRAPFVKEGKQVLTDLHGDPLEVHADPGGLQQVFVNLITNARQALSDGGRLRIATRPGADGTLSVHFDDDGAGIAPEHLPRIFEPFFTTKGVGEGTGLGLAICHGIIERHGGRIGVESRVGTGTTFVVTLPRAHDTNAHPTGTHHAR